MKICRRCRVSGKVQGVFYRASARERAVQLGVVGSAHNTSDGDVDVLVCGEQEAVEQFCHWLWEGSSASKVTDVRCEDMKWRDVRDFSID